MRARLAVLVALVLALTPTAAYADDGPDDGGAFNPVLTDSPVTVWVCVVPHACDLQGPGGPR